MHDHVNAGHTATNEAPPAISSHSGVIKIPMTSRRIIKKKGLTFNGSSHGLWPSSEIYLVCVRGYSVLYDTLRTIILYDGGKI